MEIITTEQVEKTHDSALARIFHRVSSRGGASGRGLYTPDRRNTKLPCVKNPRKAIFVLRQPGV